MKKLLSIFLTIATVLSMLTLFGCNGNGDNGSDGTTDDNTFDITGEYVIVHPMRSKDYEDTAAESVRATISAATGLNLIIKDDYFEDASEISEFEIVIGRCNRPGATEIQSKTGEIGYTVFAMDNRVYIYGTDSANMDIAVEKFISEYVLGKSEITVPDTLDITYKHEFKQPDLKINGVDISEYKIVFCSEGPTSPTRHNGKLVESGKYEDAAKKLRDEIYLLTNKKLTVVSETRADKSDYEILVGWTIRAESGAYYRENKQTFEQYAYGVSGNKLLIAGGSSNASYYAGLAFIEACENMQGSDFTSPMTKGEVDLIKIVCVGDSITDGAGRLDDGKDNDSNIHSYPVYLQKLLGFKYYVANYGHGGQRMMSFATESPNYAPSYQADPDVLIMMFGTNDANKSKYTPDWGSDAARTRYEAAATAMLTKYKSVNPDVQIFFMTPPSIIRNTTHQADCALAAQYNREYAQKNNLNLVDIWNISAAEKWVFNDGIHPQGEVYKRFAEVIFDNIKDVIIK